MQNILTDQHIFDIFKMLLFTSNLIFQYVLYLKLFTQVNLNFYKIQYVLKNSNIQYTKYTIHTRFIIDTQNIHEPPFDTRNTYTNYKFQNTTIHNTQKFQNFTTLVQTCESDVWHWLLIWYPTGNVRVFVKT